MRRPPRRVKSSATIHTHTETRRDKKVVHQDDETFVRSTLVKPGESNISVTHGRKYWFSTNTDGISVESTCEVSLSCKQKLKELERANEQASELAHKFMTDNYERVLEDVSEFLDTDPRKK